MEPDRAAELTLALAGRAELLFGPYGSGAMRAVAHAFAGRPEVVWNHGGAAGADTGARVVDVLGPAGSYWRGLPAALRAIGAPLAPAVVLTGPGGFAAATAEGALVALAADSPQPPREIHYAEGGAAGAADEALRSGARIVVGCGRFDDDVAVGRRLAGRPLGEPFVGLVACGVAAAADALGEAVTGWLGPAQWMPGGAGDPLGPDADYPAAQAFAAGIVAERAAAAAGSLDPDALWDAARALRTTTPLGPFAVDGRGRQVAHAPLIVRWAREPGGLVRRVVWRPPPAGRGAA